MQPHIDAPDANGYVTVPCRDCGRTITIDLNKTAEFVAYANGPRTGRGVACNECIGVVVWSQPTKD